MANSTIQDPNFTNTVVLVIDHDENGAFGLVVNRPGSLSLFDALEDMNEKTRDIILYQGGPVRPEALFILHSDTLSAEQGDEVIPGVYMSSSKELLEDLIEADYSYHVYSGYSGWGPGQLESELNANTWVVVPARPDIVFHPKPVDVWREALRAQGGLFAYFAANVRDPNMN